MTGDRVPAEMSALQFEIMRSSINRASAADCLPMTFVVASALVRQMPQVPDDRLRKEDRLSPADRYQATGSDRELYSRAADCHLADAQSAHRPLTPYRPPKHDFF